MFSRKTKVSCYRYRLTVFDKNTKVSFMVVKKASNKISANRLSHFVIF